MYDVVAHTGKDNTSPYQRFREDVQKSGDKKVLGKVDATIIKLREVGLDLLATNMMDTIEDRIYELRTGEVSRILFLRCAMQSICSLKWIS